jgi:transposase InsO family protein
VGRVWVMDFTELDAPDVLGRPYALVVRDLASRCILASEPCWSQDHRVVLEVLGRLLGAAEAPFVLKADNGSHFRNAEVEAQLVSGKNVVVPTRPLRINVQQPGNPLRFTLAGFDVPFVAADLAEHSVGRGDGEDRFA